VLQRTKPSEKRRQRISAMQLANFLELHRIKVKPHCVRHRTDDAMHSLYGQRHDACD
jgi:hypothetical protein